MHLATTNIVQARNIEDIYELSPIQQGLLWESQIAPGTGVYVERMTIELEGHLDTKVFARAWQDVVDRHPILRTSFHWDSSGKPLQIVKRHAPIDVEILDWRHIGDKELAAQYARWLDGDRFDVTQAPLMRLGLIRQSRERWTFAWRFSHLIMDGWSFGIAIMDWLAYYRVRLRGTTPVLPAARPYRDYVGWWQRYPPCQADRDFWQSELAGYRPPAPLHLQGARALPAGESTHAFVDFALRPLGEQLVRMCASRRLTISTVVQGAWSIVMSRYCTTSDVVVGSTSAHRPPTLQGAEAILGPLILTLPLRTNVETDAGLHYWLTELQNRHAVVREHAVLPLPALQHLPGVSTPLIETSIAIENVPLPTILLDDLDLRLAKYVYDGRPHFALSLVVLPGSEMPMRIVYDRRRFGHGAVALLAEQLAQILGSMLANPDARLGELSMRTAADVAAFARETGRPAPHVSDQTVLDRFDDHAARRPTAEATACGEERLSYAALAERSRLLASSLIARGVAAGELVGLCMGRSVDLVVGIMTILRAGAAYVPLDPSQPAARLSAIIKDGGVRTVLTQQVCLDVLADANGVTPVLVEDLSQAGDSHLYAEELERRRPTPADDMYVLFTSGSTGKPKGVPIKHGDVDSLLRAIWEHLEVAPDDVWSMCHSPGFDFSVLEIWGALTTGGRVVVMPVDSLAADPLIRAIREQGITVLSKTPSAFELLCLAEETHPEWLPSALRWVLLGGERLDPARLRPWVERHGDDQPRLVNLFGVTETTVVSTLHHLSRTDVFESSGSPIGVPLAHQRIYVLDERRQPTPWGVAGEMFIAGEAISAGYLGNSELTQERFLADPFTGGQGKMYRSGDVVRRRHDGRLEYLYRADDQVQIRGFRVEPAEVESVLLTLPGVRQAAVVAQPGRREETELIAYFVGELPPNPRGLLRKELPSYMLPSALIELERIPVNQAGKLDRWVLPTPLGQIAETEEYMPPRNDTERALVKIVCEALGLDDVGVLEDLGARGMHSLDAMRIAVCANRAFGIEVPLRSFYASPTVATLADCVHASAEAELS